MNNCIPNLLCIGSYAPAVDAFVSMTEAVTGKTVRLSSDDDGISDLILIGSDADNSILHRLCGQNVIPELGLRCGTEDIRILTVQSDARRILVLAGARNRATIYAVYTYFEQFCGCRYFWDGDITPRREDLPLTDIHYHKQFRYDYRAIRYFAHRGLHRFQAEHWSWEDWRQELDYLLKRHYNLFMLRIGTDDLFQKAFPEWVAYPRDDERDPGAIPHSYNDRTPFWSLAERGELRKKILAYAHDRDLLHPEDIGPTTHWYTPTPLDFLDHAAPAFLSQSHGSYQQNPRLQIWDCDDDENLTRYLRLTEAHIEHYGQPDIFHMIGLAERGYGSRMENYQRKTHTIRRFIHQLRQRWPNAPLLLASWDFLSQWHPDDVRRFLSELDCGRTIVLDYTTDCGFLGNNYQTWGLPNRIPWIFGIFEGYEPDNDLFFDFSRPLAALDIIRHDPMCKGVALWPEMSHANPLVLEFIACLGAGEPFSREKFCTDRYGIHADAMLHLWQQSEATFAAGAWTFDPERPAVGNNLFPFLLLQQIAAYPDSPDARTQLHAQWRLRIAASPIPSGFFAAAAAIAGESENHFVIRDLLDLSRTFLAAIAHLLLLQTQLTWRETGAADASLFTAVMHGLTDLLETHPDFSLNDSFDLLGKHHRLHPLSEDILKGGAENAYCRSYVYELCRAVYLPEAEYFMSLTAPGGAKPPSVILEKAQWIQAAFYDTPLASLRPAPHHRTRQRLVTVLTQLEELHETIIHQS